MAGKINLSVENIAPGTILRNSPVTTRKNKSKSKERKACFMQYL
jgi:hypothetical protein